MPIHERMEEMRGILAHMRALGEGWHTQLLAALADRARADEELRRLREELAQKDEQLAALGEENKKLADICHNQGGTLEDLRKNIPLFSQYTRTIWDRMKADAEKEEKRNDLIAALGNMRELLALTKENRDRQERLERREQDLKDRERHLQDQRAEVEKRERMCAEREQGLERSEWRLARGSGGAAHPVGQEEGAPVPGASAADISALRGGPERVPVPGAAPAPGTGAGETAPRRPGEKTGAMDADRPPSTVERLKK